MKMKRDDENFIQIMEKREWQFNYKKYLGKLYGKSGVYLLVFGNKKRYVGSSCNLGERISHHLKQINSTSCKDWHNTAREENQLNSYLKNREFWKLQQDIKIHFCVCEDYGEYEDQLLQAIENKPMWYNTLFRGGNKRKKEKPIDSNLSPQEWAEEFMKRWNNEN